MVLLLSEYVPNFSPTRAISQVTAGLSCRLQDGCSANWRYNEQGECAEAYYRPLEEALQRHAKALKDDRDSCRALEEALGEADRLRTEANYWQNDEEDPSGRRATSPAAANVPWRRPVEADAQDGRSIFDDVDN